MVWTESDIGDLTGQTAVVTGANGGLGLETAKALAGAGAHVVMAVRNLVKAEAACQEITGRHPQASLEIVALDLADQAAIEAAAKTIIAAHPSLDLLVNNAGLMAMPLSCTADGFETQLGVNHLGHWTLTARLLPALLEAGSPRVVTVTSVARHSSGPPTLANPHLDGSYQAWKAYGQAKKANYYFAIGLDDRFRAAGLHAASLAAHPGLSNTDLQARTVKEGGGGWASRFFHILSSGIGMSAKVGARPQLRAATDPKARGGQLYGPRFVSHGPAVRLPVLRFPGLDQRIAELWELSERETGVALDPAVS